ncbi:MAG: CDP-diacylglycerol--glycerol-3-phosphate 3-phosphatidyltransferase [Calditrichia bacterium]
MLMRLTIPNQLTLLRIALIPLFLFYYVKGEPRDQLIASGIFALASITDWYDGWYARRFGVITRWGQFMDPLADKLLVSSALIIFAWLGYIHWWMVWVIVGRDLMVTIIRIYALNQGSPIVTHGLAKWKTFIQMVTIFFILVYINWLNMSGNGEVAYQARYFDAVGILMLTVTFLTLMSAIIYIQSNWKLIMQMFKKMFNLAAEI